ncbi:hypothetical protein MNB_SV-12-697 [hydrothermal vent metagenome]|uniref:Uncharacterized protein n=1 Tax=hydrothermal vent metagenome TaxID=652676 RepID=A0A1W1BV27_9ZZZZ
MTNSTHDPYLNTVKRNLQDKYYKEQKERQKEKENMEEEKPKDFFTQEIHLSNHINLSENSINTIIISAFILIPYITGIIFIFLVIAKANIIIFNEIDIDEYFVYWSIGYEVLASILLTIIIKSAISFKRRL